MTGGDGFDEGMGIPESKREIVLAHGGKIDFTSEPGHGTRFSVWLPKRRAGRSP